MGNTVNEWARLVRLEQELPPGSILNRTIAHYRGHAACAAARASHFL